ncbi:unnamed protein product [Didymodactylos carnosus]|uniref:Uncharacterized protein n=2 Tax=Didymodactylos carnosus TaxID=1234261 RepID=A0A814U095_9BILA|nr:unnamed protein product [Didymodactylos carnosus]CAF3931449.1 unnamed protein product [Didymodactylos carnosus]
MSALDALVYFNHKLKSITFANGSTYGDLIDILGRTLKIDFTKLCIQLWDDTYKVYLDLDEEYFDEVKDLIHKSLSEKAFSISFRFIRRAFPCPLPKTPRAITRQPSADKSADCQFDEPDTDGDLYDAQVNLHTFRFRMAESFIRHYNDEVLYGDELPLLYSNMNELNSRSVVPRKSLEMSIINMTNITFADIDDEQEEESSIHNDFTRQIAAKFQHNKLTNGNTKIGDNDVQSKSSLKNELILYVKNIILSEQRE